MSKSLEGTAVDEIIEIRGWKAEKMAMYYIGATTGAYRSKGTKEATRQRLRYSE